MTDQRPTQTIEALVKLSPEECALQLFPLLPRDAQAVVFLTQSSVLSQCGLIEKGVTDFLVLLKSTINALVFVTLSCR